MPFAEIGRDIQKAVNHLRNGEIIGLPTETVYGLAANALDVAAVLRIFETKQRPHFDPLICHVSSLDRIPQWVSEFPDVLMELARMFTPGPLTLLLPKRSLIPDLVTSGLDRAAFRVPAHPVAQAVLEQLDFPVAAPSANPFGYVSPTTAQHVAAQLGNTIPFILDGGPCAVGLESTIVGLEDGKVTVYRLGGVSIEAIESVVGQLQLQINQSSNPKAPGQLKSHYAPRKRLILNQLSDLSKSISTQRKQAFIGFDSYTDLLPREHQFLLSENGSMQQAAQRLFDLLRTLDQSDFDEILAIPVPEQDLGRAINDRLRRAAS